MKPYLCAVILIIVSWVIGCAAISVVFASPATTPSQICKIPQGYYNSPCQKPAHLTFYDWMATLPMPPYEVDAFDCSQRAAYIEWLSENCGHRATIAGGFGPGWGHIWVLIDIDNVPFAYETTWPPHEGHNGRWKSRESDWYYNLDTEWESIYEAPFHHSRFEMEYAWWIIYPSLVFAVWEQQ